MFKAMNIFVCIKLFIFIVSLNTVNAEVLRCYVCIDCDTVNETHINSCVNPDNPVSETPITDQPTTILISTPTQEITVTNTVAPSTYSTTTEASFTRETTSDSTSTTNNPMSSVTDELNTNVPLTTTTETEASSTTGGETESTSSLEAPIVNMYGIELPNIKVKVSREFDPVGITMNFPISDESVPDETKLKESAKGSSKYSSSLYNVQMAEVENRPRRAIISSAEETNRPSETRCVVTKYVENSKTRIKRGCSFISGEAENRCRELIGESFSGNLIHCSVCDESLCNSASKSAITLITSSVFLVLIFNM